MALGKLKRGKINLLDFLIGLLLASLAHGFYDFWLINEAFYMPLVTTFFFLGSLHMWVTMKNNLINSSNFYDKNIELDRHKLQYKLVSWIVLILFLGYVFIGLMTGPSYANRILLYGLINYLFIIVYITTTFSSYNIIRGYKAPIRFPLKFFKPKVEAYPNYVGSNIVLHSRRMKGKRNDPIHGIMQERKVVEHDYNWYLFKVDDSMKYYLLRPLTFDSGFSRSNHKKVKMCLLDSSIDLKSTEITKEKMMSCRVYLAYLK